METTSIRDRRPTRIRANCRPNVRAPAPSLPRGPCTTTAGPSRRPKTLGRGGGGTAWPLPPLEAVEWLRATSHCRTRLFYQNLSDIIASCSGGPKNEGQTSPPAGRRFKSGWHGAFANQNAGQTLRHCAPPSSARSPAQNNAQKRRQLAPSRIVALPAPAVRWTARPPGGLAVRPTCLHCRPPAHSAAGTAPRPRTP